MSEDILSATRGDLKQMVEDHTLGVVRAVDDVRKDVVGVRCDLREFREEVRERFEKALRGAGNTSGVI